MSNEKKEESKYPVRSLHDFLEELNKEWDRFRTGSLIGKLWYQYKKMELNDRT